jgi:hypothetical protein
MTASDETPMTDPADRARAFFAARRLVTRTLSDELGFSVDLVNTSGKLVAPEYGHGASEKDALVSAVKRYRIEEADWDQDGIQILLEFVPTTTASAGLRGVVASAFAREGLATAEYERPAFQMTAESSHPGWKWGSPSLSVHLVSNLPTIEVVEKLIQGVGIALASIRKHVPDLPFEVDIDRSDKPIRLAFRHDDFPNEMERAMDRLPPDLASRRTMVWDRDRQIWSDLLAH